MAVIVAAIVLFCGKPVSVYAISSDQGSLVPTTSWQLTGKKSLGGGFPLFLNQDDTYSFSATAGYSYIFTLGSACWSGADNLTEGKLIIYNSNGSEIGRREDGCSDGAPLIRLINAAGTFYVRVAGNGLIYSADYNLAYRKEANLYTVSYNGNGNTSGSTASSSHTYDVSKSLTANGFDKTGYTFAGWATSANNPAYYSNQQLVSNLTTTYNGTYPLYAKWTPIIYSVSLNNQNGMGGTSVISATYDASMPSGNSAPTRTGYTFGGYYTGTNGTGTQYYDASMYSVRKWDIASDYTILYAKWTAKQYTVTLNNPSGTGGTSAVTTTYDASMPSATAPTRTGYTFGGYYTGTNGTGTQYYDASMYSVRNWDINTNTTLFAYWIGNDHTITTAENGGNTVADLTYTVNPSSQTKILTTPTYTAYTVSYNANGHGTAPTSQTSTKPFSGWSITANSSPASSVSSNTLTVPANAYGNITVTAQWGNFQSITLPTPAVTGYTFGGWYSEAACTNLVANGGTSYTPSANRTLYAKWTANTYTITYNGNGNTSGSTALSSHTYDMAKTLTANGFSKTDYTFMGWATSASGSVSYSNGQSVSNLTVTQGATVTLYAKWAMDENRIDSLFAINAALQKQIATLQQDTTSLNVQVNALQADTAAYINQIGELQADTVNLHNQIAALQADAESCSQNTAVLLAQIAGLQADTATLYLQNTNLQNQLSEAGQNITTLQNDLLTANNANNTLQMQNTGLQNQLSAASQSITTLQDDLATANNTINMLQTNTDTLLNQLATANDSINTLQTEKVDLQNQLNTANNTITTLQSEKAGLQSQLSTVNSTVSSLQTQITSLNSQIAALQAALEDCQSGANAINAPKAIAVQIYPNPAKEELFIKSDWQIQRVEIYTSSGTLLLSENNFNEKISVSSLPKGVYLLKVYSGSEVAVSKIVKE
ncbi:hypothetical protein FACS1894176_07610 [Bacteroidia bacterium]|nr:hypothetical protein FACS1894176_07610 [Bacteroidia bacterium]